MKKIITTLLFGISVFANNLFAQDMPGEQLRIFQTDNLEDIKKAFKQDDFTKCFQIKETSYNLFSLSVIHQRKNVFNYLLAENTDVNKTCSGITPLMYAAMYGYTDTAKTLIKKGAKKSVKDKNGKTAKDYAIENKHAATAAIL